MTTKQRIDYKAANQKRKKQAIENSRRSDAMGGDKTYRSYWARLGHIQDGKYSRA